jgi:cytochrome c553
MGRVLGTEGKAVKKLFVTVFATAIFGAPCATAADNSAATTAESVATSTCQNCHGAQGNSVSSTFPRLNGQKAEYIAAQLNNFRSHNRSDPHARAYMWGMAAQLDDASIAALAQYYASQTPTLPQKGGALAAQGAALFANGAPAQNMPPCQSCHGEHAEGNGIFPRLAGQHADYLKKQLEAFRSSLRESDVMHVESKDMTDSQIEALVSYLAND